MSKHPITGRELIELSEDDLPGRARQVAEDIAGELFVDGLCRFCGCPRYGGESVGYENRTHYLITVGAYLPTVRDDIEQIRCEVCDVACWPADI